MPLYLWWPRPVKQMKSKTKVILFSLTILITKLNFLRYRHEISDLHIETYFIMASMQYTPILVNIGKKKTNLTSLGTLWHNATLINYIMHVQILLLILSITFIDFYESLPFKLAFKCQFCTRLLKLALHYVAMLCNACHLVLDLLGGK